MFFVYFNRKSSHIPSEILSQDVIHQLCPYETPDRSGSINQERTFMVQTLFLNTRQSQFEETPLIDEDDQLVIVSWARLDNRNELAGLLGIANANLAIQSESMLILKAYQKWGEECVQHLIGDFVFVIYNMKTQTLFCARDHMGVRPFYYYLTDFHFICATSLRPLVECPQVSVDIDEQWMVDYMTHLSMSFDKTPYQGILKIPPAHSLKVGVANHQMTQYFNLSEIEPLRLKTSEDYVDAYREVLEEAVACRVLSDYPLGTELSGGIDSSTITAYAAKFMENRITDLHAFSFANLEMEPEYIFAVSRMYGISYNHVVTGRQNGSSIERALDILAYPVEHGNATHHEPFYRIAEKFNVRTLLSGFGGDEFGTTIHADLAIRELLMKGNYFRVLRLMHGNPFFQLLRFMKLYYRRVKTKGFSTEQYRQNFLAAWKQRWPQSLVRPEIAEKYNLKERYFDTARFDAGYTDLKKFTLEKRWMPFVPTRMDNCTLMAASHKIEYRWPLLDVRLVKQFLSTPSEENCGPAGMGRYLHRRAIEGVVPDLVRWKRTKYMGDLTISIDGFMGNSLIDNIDCLHPVLKEILDMKKLRNQLKQAQHMDGDEPSKVFLLRRNLGTAMQLNEWLQFSDRIRQD